MLVTINGITSDILDDAGVFLVLTVRFLFFALVYPKARFKHVCVYNCNFEKSSTKLDLLEVKC